ncbi:MAG: c-type cytochrome [Candidatus Kapaibacteriota bacterium]
MEFFNAIAIPHNEQVLKLLEILFFIGFSIFVLYFAFLFGGAIISLIYYFKATTKNDDYYLNVSKKYLHYVAKGNIAIIGLGLVPLLALYYSLLQFLQKAPNDFSLAFSVSIALFVFDVIILKVLLFRSKSINFIKPDILYIVLLCLVSLSSLIIAFISIGVFTICVNGGFQLSAFSFSDFLDSNSIIRYFLFVAIAFIITPLSYIFKTYSADRVSIEGNYFTENGIIKRALSNVLIVGNIFPILLFISYLIAPKNLVTLQNFVFTVTSILILLLCIIFSYFSLKENKISFAKYAFVSALVSFLLLFASDTTLLAVSNKTQEFKIARDYITYHEQLLASAGRKTGVQINGEEIYKAKCVACHQFDTKLVGPPHKEVLKKYENRKEDMVKFILNPVKVDPNYPPMPNQGLKPQEAEAVVNYMFEHYGPMLK